MSGGLMRNSALAFAADATGKAGTLGVLAIAGRALSTREFAAAATALSAATLLTAGLDLGAQTLLARDGTGGPGARAALLRGLLRARAPLAFVAVAGALAVGLVTGRPLEAALTAGIAVAGALLLSLAGAVRSTQDLRPEALARLAGAVGGLALGAVALWQAPRASTLLAALLCASLLSLAPLGGAARRATRAGAAAGRVAAPAAGAATARALLARALPLGLMALATLAYYRSGTIAVSLLSTPEQTARFAAATTIGFGLLAAANAVTTALLPRLAAGAGAAERAACLRRALAATTLAAAGLALAAALLAPLGLGLLFGHRYAAAAPVLAILAAATVPIAVAGVLGTALLAARRVRPVAIQVGASLAVNLAALGILAPGLGAVGAALATLACELAAVALLAVPAARAYPGALRVALRPRPLAFVHDPQPEP